MHQIDMPVHYHVRSELLERYQRYTTKMTNIAEMKTALFTIWNDLAQEFTDKAIASFCNRL